MSEDELVGEPGDCDPGTGECVPALHVLLRLSLQGDGNSVREEWVDGPTSSTYPTATTITSTLTGGSTTFEVSAQVNPSGVESERKQLSWTGEGTPQGYRVESSHGGSVGWAWVGWTSTHQRQPPTTDVMTTTLADGRLQRDTAFTLKGGNVVLMRRDVLDEVSCRDWAEQREALLATPTPGAATTSSSLHVQAATRAPRSVACADPGIASCPENLREASGRSVTLHVWTEP